MKKVVILVMLLVIIGGALYGYKLYQEKTPDAINQEAEVSITAKELLQAFEDDPATAQKKYVNRIIQVTGIVKKVDTSGAVIMGEDGNASEISIGLDRRHIADAMKIKPGTRISLQG